MTADRILDSRFSIFDLSVGRRQSRIANLKCRARVALLVACVLACAPGDAADQLKTHSRSAYVHRIALYDSAGEVISPDDDAPAPYSPKATCGKCHPYDTIRKGWHFNAGAKGAADGRPGEPWVWVDRATGAQIPLSMRQWPGAYRLDQAGVTPWQFALRFGTHFPGGGVGERYAEKPVDKHARWAIAGAMEIDCLACHSTSPRFDMASRERQIENQNFRWLPTVAAGLAVVRGDTMKLPDDYDPEFPDMAGGDAKPPKTLYDKTRFDADDRVVLEMRRKPTDNRCLYCHSTRIIGQEAWRQDGDVHTRAGLKCVDCHRNGIDHQIDRGASGGFSCRGCHLGARRRFGAPRPLHRGLPALHLEELACTTCHSGPRPKPKLYRFQTARIHGLGLPSKHRTSEEPPIVVGPIFKPGRDGKIRPHYAFWPIFLGTINSGIVGPVERQRVGTAAKGAMPERTDKRVGQVLPDASSVGKMTDALGGLADCSGTNLVYVSAGKALVPTPKGKFEEFSDTNEADIGPYAWPMAHDVRPAAQALGAGGCTDCHSAASAFFFAPVQPTPAPPGVAPAAQPMYAAMGVDARLVLASVWTAKFHPWFVAVVLLCAGLLAAGLVRYALLALARLGKRKS